MNKPNAVDIESTAWQMKRLENLSTLCTSLEGVQQTLNELSRLVTDEMNALDAEVVRMVTDIRKEELA